MTSQESDPKERSGNKLFYRFLGGAALGAFVVAVPISYSSFTDVNLTQWGTAVFLVLLCGLLSSIWGEKFIDAVMRVLDSFAA